MSGLIWGDENKQEALTESEFLMWWMNVDSKKVSDIYNMEP